jgi:hypothetical protein
MKTRLFQHTIILLLAASQSNRPHLIACPPTVILARAVERVHLDDSARPAAGLSRPFAESDLCAYLLLSFRRLSVQRVDEFLDIGAFPEGSTV